MSRKSGNINEALREIDIAVARLAQQYRTKRFTVTLAKLRRANENLEKITFAVAGRALKLYMFNGNGKIRLIEAKRRQRDKYRYVVEKIV